LFEIQHTSTIWEQALEPNRTLGAFPNHPNPIGQSFHAIQEKPIKLICSQDVS